jgi:hypothetical protein
MSRRVMLAVLCFGGLAAAACAGDEYKPPLTSIGGAVAQAEARTDCKEIMGTPFRSTQERQWFENNCSKWPPTNFGDLVAARTQNEAPECANMRGRPYATNDQRQWFLTNCTGPASANPLSSDIASTSAPARPECVAIRSNGNPSTAERAWYAQNCSAPSGVQAYTTPGTPDRTDCNAIRGTPYQSPSERAWFLQYCGGIVQSQGSPQVILLYPAPAPSDSRNNNNSRQSNPGRGRRGD